MEESKKAFIYSATEPDDRQRARFEAFLTDKYNSPYELVWEKDESVGSGFRLKAGGDVYDWTEEGRFRQLADMLDTLDGKDVLIIDDMISSGDSMIDVAKELKRRNAKRVFCLSTFGMFTNGLEKFDKAYEEGLIYRVITTNSTYQRPELFEREWYVSADVSKYIALLIDALNHNSSISQTLNPHDRIKNRLAEYAQYHTIHEE